MNNYFFEDHWMIGVAPLKMSDVIKKGINFDKITIYNPSKKYYYADPFWHPQLDEGKLICERFDFTTQHGSISEIKIEDDKITEEQTLLKEDWHLSFPFLIEHEGGLKMIPEASYNNESQVYPLESLDAKPFIKKALVDPVIYLHNETYWLFASIQNGKQNEELHLFWSDDFENWNNHSSSPICTNSFGARMAGNIVSHENELFRFGQNCEKGYGKGIVIHKINELSKDQYSETAVGRIDAPANFSGIHTINQFEDKVVFDLKKTYFSPLKPFRRLRRKLFS